MTGLVETDGAILALWDDGLGVAEIAAVLRVGEPRVEAVVADVGRRFDHVPFARWISTEEWELHA